MRRPHLFGVAILFCLFAVGCGSRNPNAPASVSGHVRYKGSAVPAGVVTFHVEDKGSYTGHLNSSGAYEISDVPIGEAVVTVDTEVYNPKKKAARDYGDGKGAADYAKRIAIEKPMKETPPAEFMALPAKYLTKKDSPLKATVEAGKQVKDFELTD